MFSILGVPDKMKVSSPPEEMHPKVFSAVISAPLDLKPAKDELTRMCNKGLDAYKVCIGSNNGHTELQ